MVNKKFTHTLIVAGSLTTTLSAQSYLSSSGDVDATKINGLLSGAVTDLSVDSIDAQSSVGALIFQENTLTLANDYLTDSGKTLKAGETYTSFFIVSYEGGTSGAQAGSFTFDAIVGGFDFTDATLKGVGSDIWEVAGVTYPTNGVIGYESNDTFSLGRATTRFDVSYSVPGDRGRIFVGTVFVPEPSSAALSALAGIMIATRRKRS